MNNETSSSREQKQINGLPTELTDLEFDFDNQKASNIDVLSTKKMEREKKKAEMLSDNVLQKGSTKYQTEAFLVAGLQSTATLMH